MRSFSTCRLVSLFACLMVGASASAAPAAGNGGSERPPEIIELSLEEAVQLAVTRSFRTARSRRNEQISELRYDGARSNYMPRASLGASARQYSRGEYGDARFDPESARGDFGAGLNGSLWMPLDIAGVVKRQVGQADAQRQIASHDVLHATLEVALETQNNYLNALRAQSNVGADRRVVEQIEELLEKSRARAPGVVPFLEVELGNAQQSLNNSRANADQAQDGLKQTLRIPLDTPLHLSSKMTDETQTLDQGDLLEQALSDRPDVQQARLRIRQAELSQRQVTDQRMPTVSLGGYYNNSIASRSLLDEDRRRNGSHGFGLNVQVPLTHFDGGQLSKQKRIAGLQKEQAMADADELRERVAYDLRQALLAVERAENRIESLPDQKQAFEALKRAEEQMLGAPEGQAQSLLAQVSNARNAWRSAQTASANAYIDYNRAVFRLNRTLGQVDIDTNVPEDIPLASVPAHGAADGR